MYQRVFYGQVTNAINNLLPDLSGRERLALWPAAVAVLIMGVASPVWIHPMEASVRAALAPTAAATATIENPRSPLHRAALIPVPKP
jgi:NADH-quinone oxidoreductase subunit M